MSKLAKAIMATDSGERYMVQSPFNFTDIKAQWSNDVANFRKLYHIGVIIDAKAIVDDSLSDRSVGPALTVAVKDAKRAIIEEIFGEFRAPITQLRMAMYDRDFSKAQNILAQLEDQMFHEGIND